MCSLTMQYCCKTCMPMLLSSCPVRVCVNWLLGQNVGGILVGGIISSFNREAEKAIFSRGGC